VRIGDGPWRVLDGGAAMVTVPAGAPSVTVEARNDKCCESTSETIRADQDGKTVAVSLGFLPARITPRCEQGDVRVVIDDRTARLDKVQQIPFGDTLQTSKTVKVEFIGETIDTQEITVTYAEEREVTCKFD
jgi:hypothetical protein